MRTWNQGWVSQMLGDNHGGGVETTTSALNDQDFYKTLMPREIVEYMMFESPISWCYINMSQNWQQVCNDRRFSSLIYEEKVEYFIRWLKYAEMQSLDKLLQDQNNGKAVRDRERHPAYREI